MPVFCTLSDLIQSKEDVDTRFCIPEMCNLSKVATGKGC